MIEEVPLSVEDSVIDSEKEIEREASKRKISVIKKSNNFISKAKTEIIRAIDNPGDESILREQVVTVLDTDENVPGETGGLSCISRKLCACFGKNSKTDTTAGSMQGSSRSQHYRLESHTKSHGLLPLVSYLDWSFQASFLAVFFVQLLGYMALTCLFGGFLLWAWKMNPECIYIGGAELGDSDFNVNFGDAFALSWTTFSTVGYGHTFPSTSFISDGTCAFVVFLTCMEAFVGIIFAGFCGAIIFSKVVRVQSQARVIFSDPMCIRYGAGLLGDADNDNDSNSSPCPVLEFRIVNELYKKQGGEIMNATLSCVAASVVDEDDVFYCSTTERQEIDEGFGKMKRRVFTIMKIDPAHHPLFKRVTLFRHTLDETSPLLSESMKRKVEENNGRWPSEMNACTDVRDALHFNDIIVSFSGVLNNSATNVYAHKIYDYLDINIGYQFVPILYRKKKHRMWDVDMNMINDVKIQKGGGAEPFTTSRDSQVL